MTTICSEVHSNVNGLHWPQNKAGNNQKNMGENGRVSGKKKKGKKTKRL